MKPAPASRLGLVLGLMLVPATQALGAPAGEQSELVAFHPCVIVGERSKEKTEDYQGTCSAEVARASVQLVPSEHIHTFLEKEPKKSCALAKVPAECLGRLATATHAARSLLITIHPGLLTKVSGLVVGEHGEVIDQKSIQIRSRGQPQEELIRTSVMRLREQLDLVPLKVPPLVEKPPPTQQPIAEAPLASDVPTTAPSVSPPVSSSPPPALQVNQEDSRPRRTWKTPVAYTAGGLGVVGLGIAGFYAYKGEQSVRAANSKFPGPYPYAGDIPDIQRLQLLGHQQRTTALVSAAAGVLFIGGGVALWLLDRPRPTQPAITGLSVGPSGVGLLGVLP